MQSKPLILSLMILLSLMAGCVEDIREEQSVEKKEDLRNIDDSIVANDIFTQNTDIESMISSDTTDTQTKGSDSLMTSENMTQEECEREGGIWIEVVEVRSETVEHDDAMSTIRKLGGFTDNNSIDDYDNDGSGGLNWDEFVEIWNSVEDQNLTNDSQVYREIFASFHDIDFDSDGELSIAELLRAQEDIIMNTRPSWCSFGNDNDFEITQELCEERSGTWTEAPDREGESYCEYDDERDESESNTTQEDCERRGGDWHEEDQYCDMNEDEREEESESNTAQEDCEERGGTWIEDRRECHEE